MRRSRVLIKEILEDEDEPMSGLANLFDVALVFALAFLVALLISFNISELLNPEESVTIVKNPGKENMQVIIKEGKKIKVMNVTEQLASGTGKKVGTAYKLKTGEIIYVPENEIGD